MENPNFTYEYQQWLLKLAIDNLDKGVIYEPRGYFDEILVPDTTDITARSAAEVFQNGERFPVRLTHVTASMQYLDAENAVTDEREIQRVGLSMQFHDQWYMNDRFVTVPAWGTDIVAAAPEVSLGTSAWRFEKPFILSSRDTLDVKVQLIQPALTGIPVTVSFTGIGMKSKRPYFFSGSVALTDATLQTIPGSLFKNDGAEPVLVTDMTVNCAGALGSDDPTGDIRNVRVQIRQQGNGTGSRWFIGPTTPTIIQAVGATNLGVYSGRAVVHRFPGEGLLWEPGEGIDVWVQRLVESAVGVKLSVGLFGYIAVQ